MRRNAWSLLKPVVLTFAKLFERTSRISAFTRSPEYAEYNPLSMRPPCTNVAVLQLTYQEREAEIHSVQPVRLSYPAEFVAGVDITRQNLHPFPHCASAARPALDARYKLKMSWTSPEGMFSLLEISLIGLPCRASCSTWYFSSIRLVCFREPIRSSALGAAAGASAGVCTTTARDNSAAIFPDSAMNSLTVDFSSSYAFCRLDNWRFARMLLAIRATTTTMRLMTGVFIRSSQQTVGAVIDGHRPTLQLKSLFGWIKYFCDADGIASINDNDFAFCEDLTVDEDLDRLVRGSIQFNDGAVIEFQDFLENHLFGPEPHCDRDLDFHHQFQPGIGRVQLFVHTCLLICFDSHFRCG